MNINQITRGAVATVAALLLAHSAQADSLYNISLDLSSLASGTNAPYYLDFQFASGTVSSDGNNTATLGGFSFSGISAGVNGSITSTGAASGDSLSAISLVNSSTPSEWFQAINAGTTNISFNLDLTTLVNFTTPDRFSIAILDSSTGQIATTSPDALSLATIDISSATSNTVATYTGVAPTTVSATVSTVPEPSTYALFGLGALVLIVVARRRAA